MPEMRSLQTTHSTTLPERFLREKRICLVEDDPYQLNIVQQMLDPEVEEIHIFPDGQTALGWLMENPVDLVVADVMMPGLDGWALHAKVRASGANRETPWLFTTCVIDRNEEPLMSDPNAGTLTIAKPFDKNTLLRGAYRCLKECGQLHSS